MGSFAVSEQIEAPPPRVWSALADIGDIHRWNPGVRASHATTEQAGGLGARRHCKVGGRNYLDEEVVEWEDGSRLTMRVIGTNLPFKTADIRFRLDGNGDATTVTVSPEYELKFGPLGRLMDRMMVRSQYEKGMRTMLAGLKREVEGSA
ncbi:MAG: SRPBCC family protein [Gemmatimonadota bacterium]